MPASAVEPTLGPHLLDEDVTFDLPNPPDGQAPGLRTVEPTIQGRQTVLPRVEYSENKPRLLTIREKRYDVLKPLGAGGAGEVFLAQDQDIGRKIAIKKVRAAATSRAALVRFVQEVQTIGRLEHPNIIPIHDVGQDENGDYYFVMKYVEGQTLEEVIERLRAGDAEAHRQFSLEHRVSLVKGVIEALAFAHDRGVIHRDIKPANVMVGEYGEVLLLDWGIALAQGPADAPAPAEGVLIGTPRYMSPEQAAKRPVDARSDVYSVSVLMHELLTLTHYLGDVEGLEPLLEGVRTRPVRLATLCRHPHQEPVPADLSWFIQAGVHKDPDQRIQSMTEMLDRLERRANGEIHVQCPVTMTKRMSSESLRFVDRRIVPWLGPAFSLGPVGMVVLTLVMVGGLVGLLAAALAALMGLSLALGFALGLTL